MKMMLIFIKLFHEFPYVVAFTILQLDISIAVKTFRQKITQKIPAAQLKIGRIKLEAFIVKLAYAHWIQENDLMQNENWFGLMLGMTLSTLIFFILSFLYYDPDKFWLHWWWLKCYKILEAFCYSRLENMAEFQNMTKKMSCKSLWRKFNSV